MAIRQSINSITRVVVLCHARAMQPLSCVSIKGAAIFCLTSFVLRKKERDGRAVRWTKEIESPTKNGAREKSE